MPASFETFALRRKSQSAGGIKMHVQGTLFVFFVVAIQVVILAALYLRYRYWQMLHQERLAALEKGIAGPMGSMLGPGSPRAHLLRGLLWSFAGTALIICLLGIAASSHRPESADVTLWRAKNLAQSLNISAEEARQIAEKDREVRQNGMPFSVALLGLIPVGVGLAYLVFYYTGERRGLENSPN
jgi:hypothetical protein